jgi:hypothetical protein
MKKTILALTAVITAVIVLPATAGAQGISVRVGDDRGMHRGYGHDYREHRAEFRGDHDRGWHRGWRNRDRVVVIKQRRHRHWD